MICPTCNKPYYFISKDGSGLLECLKCSHRGDFSEPDYSGYHSSLYDKPYRRDAKTDPQMMEILKVLGIKSSDRVLDIGCGPGDYTAALSKISKNAIGLDLDVGLARRKYKGLNFISHDCNLDTLPFEDSSIDAIVSISLIEHLKDPEFLLKECRRVLREGGRIALTTANLDFFLHNFFFDKTHLHEWDIKGFSALVGGYFKISRAKKSSSMFNYHPFNFVLVHFLKPDLLIIGEKV